MYTPRDSLCTGDCCKEFVIGGASLTELRQRAQAHPESEELQKVVSLLVVLRTDGDGWGWFTCNKWDPVTKLCTDYENRPLMCSEYPEYETGEPCLHCGWGWREGAD